MWKAESSSGDYHDNMNSDMFMKWVEQRLVPTFEAQFPGKKMILIADNAPYHHKRVGHWVFEFIVKERDY